MSRKINRPSQQPIPDKDLDNAARQAVVNALQEDPGPVIIVMGLNLVTQKASFTMTHTNPEALSTYIQLMQQVTFELQKRLEGTSSTKAPNAP